MRGGGTLDEHLAGLLDGYDVRAVRRVHGGDINAAWRVDTAAGPVFAKTHPAPKPDMFAREAAGLMLLRRHAPAGLGVPEVLGRSTNGLLLTWIEPGRGHRSTEADFGRLLAELHQVSHPTFGGIDDQLAGYLGSAEVDLTPTDDWADFYYRHRLLPLAQRGVDLGTLPRAALARLEGLAPRVPELCGPPEPPALLHGDLWAGNRLVDLQGHNWLIDPSVHWGHREYDLAMMRLFGGFGADAFAAYDEAFPLATGWRERIAWYQLAPLLVHAILFGGHYGTSAAQVISSY